MKKHDDLRNILISYGCEEFGDAIIDEICHLFGHKDTNGDVQNVKKIEIPFSFEDLEQLRNGDTFDWRFDDVDVHLFNEEETND
jgi:hypothetical protein